MKTIKDYLEKNGSFVEYIGGKDFGFALVGGYIIVEVDNGDVYELKTESEIQITLYDNYGIEIRFCEECGIPFDAGFMMDGGFWYSCEECFEEAMNKKYGKGKWRPTSEEGYYGGFYEYFDGNEWEDTGIFYTEWY